MERDLKVARQLLKDSPAYILGPNKPAFISPNSKEEWHDIREMYGPNYDRLVELKRRYDPKNRLGGMFKP